MIRIINTLNFLFCSRENSVYPTNFSSPLKYRTVNLVVMSLLQLSKSCTKHILFHLLKTYLTWLMIYCDEIQVVITRVTFIKIKIKPEKSFCFPWFSSLKGKRTQTNNWANEISRSLSGTYWHDNVVVDAEPRFRRKIFIRYKSYPDLISFRNLFSWHSPRTTPAP